jgi:D-amino-acid dehydrogenase
MEKVAVIGAGIAGISAAYYLARAGYTVTVYDQERYPAMQTSKANGGQISVSNSEVWTTWANVGRGLRWMFTKDAPLLIRPSLNLDKLSWLSKFMMAVLSGDSARKTGETIRLGIKNRQLLQNLMTTEDISYNYSQCGIMHIYKNPAYYQHAALAQELYKANGCEWELINSEQAYRIDPALKQIRDLDNAAWTPSDSVGDIHKFCYNLSLKLKLNYNVKFEFNTKIDKIDSILNDYDLVIVANGVHAQQIGQQLKDKLNIYPVKGYSITIDIDALSRPYCPTVSLLDDEAKIVTSTLGNQLRVAGTAELDGYNRDIRRERIEPLLNWVEKNFPGINTRNYTSWACLRPMTPDMMPIVRRSQHNSKVWYHCGHGHLGWTLSLATANELVKQIQDDKKIRMVS